MCARFGRFWFIEPNLAGAWLMRLNYPGFGEHSPKSLAEQTHASLPTLFEFALPWWIHSPAGGIIRIGNFPKGWIAKFEHNRQTTENRPGRYAALRRVARPIGMQPRSYELYLKISHVSCTILVCLLARNVPGSFSLIHKMALSHIEHVPQWMATTHSTKLNGNILCRRVWETQRIARSPLSPSNSRPPI